MIVSEAMTARVPRMFSNTGTSFLEKSGSPELKGVHFICQTLHQRWYTEFMPEEYFDIVDENNNPTGKRAARKEAHARGLWHRTVHVYLFRRKGNTVEFLVHLRAKTKDLHPDMWDTRIGGHFKAGQTLEEASVCEVKEEIGVDISHDHLLAGGVRKKERFPNNEFVYSFFLEFEHEHDLEFPDGEIQRVEWMEADNITDSMKRKERPWSAGVEGFQHIYSKLMEQL